MQNKITSKVHIFAAALTAVLCVFLCDIQPSLAYEDSEDRLIVIRHGYLSDTDIANYNKIFALQKKERWLDADKVIAKLDDKVLLGYVLGQRYLESATWKTKSAEAKEWLGKYSDLPFAGKIYDLGKKKGATFKIKRPKDIDNIPAGSCSLFTLENPIDLLRSFRFNYLPKEKRVGANKLMNRIIGSINRGKTLTAYNYITSKEAAELFRTTEIDTAKTALAFLYFTDLMDERALEVISPAVARSGKQVPMANWVMGLIYWRMNDFESAGNAFADAASNPKTKPVLASAAAYWAARANFRLGRTFTAENWLEQSAKAERYFYGILARRSLGEDIDHSWQRPEDEDATEDEILNKPAVRRAIALFQLGRDKRGEDELLKYYVYASNTERSALIDLVEKNGLPELSSVMISLSGKLETQDGKLERANYPAPNWTPLGGWQVDKALVYAFVRQESCFDKKAVSGVGARGLMQIMPTTARETAKVIGLEWDSLRLTEPAYNLAIGQAYIQKLLKDKFIGGNLIFLSVAYNSGPGNLYRWSKRMDWQEDPLLFIESIPSKQTRSFVQRILSNYWVYSSLFGSDGIDTLDAVIEGSWPKLIL